MIARLFSPHGRIFLAALFGGAVYTMLPETLRWSMRALAAWDCGALLYIVLAAAVMRDGTPDEMRRRAELYDEPQLSFVVLTLLAVAASFAAIFVEFSAAKTAPQPLIPIALGGFTLIISWAFAHLMFAMHYAHLQYGTGLAAGGIVRPEKGNLNYTDILYFSFLIGCATETSDFVSVNSAMRRFMIVHSVIAYLFNVVIIALTISVVSSFI
jgi:uncharacterized membrane protein